MDLTKQGRMCAEAAGELAEATERIIRILLTATSAGNLADSVYSVISQAKTGVVLLEQAHLELEVAAGRPPGTGPSLDNDGVDRQTYEPPNCGSTRPHGQHSYSPVGGLELNCPGVAGERTVQDA